MLDIKFRLQWFEDLKEWRISGGGGIYVTAKTIEGIPKAVKMMMNAEASAIMRAAE